MESIVQYDVFFFITTVVVILIGILAAAICVSIIGILRHIKAAIRKVEVEAEEIITDVHSARNVVKKFIKVDKTKGNTETQKQRKRRS